MTTLLDLAIIAAALFLGLYLWDAALYALQKRGGRR